MKYWPEENAGEYGPVINNYQASKNGPHFGTLIHMARKVDRLYMPLQPYETREARTAQEQAVEVAAPAQDVPRDTATLEAAIAVLPESMRQAIKACRDEANFPEEMSLRSW